MALDSMQRRSKVDQSQVGRRGFLRAVASSTVVPTLSSFLYGFENGIQAAENSAVVDKNVARNAIVVILSGGMSQLDSFDYKTKAPNETRGPFKPTLTKTEQSVFSSQFPRLASIDDQFALFRAMKASSFGSHQTAFRDWLNATADGRHIFEYILERKQAGVPYVEAIAPGVLPLMDDERDELLLQHALTVQWDERKKDYVSLSRLDKPDRLDELMAQRDKLNSLQRISGSQVVLGCSITFTQEVC